MSVEGAVLARLAAVSAVTTLVGSRLYGAKLPQNVTLPAVCLTLVSETREGGWGPTGNSVRVAQIQLDCYDETYDGVADLAEAIETGLDRWDGTADTTVVLGTFIGLKQDMGTGDLLQGDSNEFRRMLEFAVHYREN